MAMASLTADLLARKGSAHPTRKWLRSGGSQLPGASFLSQDDTSGSGTMPMATNDEQDKRATKDHQVTKSLRIDTELNRQLKLLAARADKSQQALMEQAVRYFVATELDKADCICGADL